MKRQQGMMLVITLLLLSLLSVFILTQLDVLWLHQKATNQFIDAKQQQYRLEQVAMQLFEHFSAQTQKDCLIAGDENPNDVVRRLVSHSACVIEKETLSYWFLFEEIGVHPCLQIQTPHQVYSTAHWRLTVYSEAYQPYFLQLRFATLADYRVCMGPLVRQIAPGLVSWRRGGA